MKIFVFVVVDEKKITGVKLFQTRGATATVRERAVTDGDATRWLNVPLRDVPTERSRRRDSTSVGRHAGEHGEVELDPLGHSQPVNATKQRCDVTMELACSTRVRAVQRHQSPTAACPLPPSNVAFTTDQCRESAH